MCVCPGCLVRLTACVAPMCSPSSGNLSGLQPACQDPNSRWKAPFVGQGAVSHAHCSWMVLPSYKAAWRLEPSVASRLASAKCRWCWVRGCEGTQLSGIVELLNHWCCAHAHYLAQCVPKSADDKAPFLLMNHTRYVSDDGVGRCMVTWADHGTHPLHSTRLRMRSAF